MPSDALELATKALIELTSGVTVGHTTFAVLIVAWVTLDATLSQFTIPVAVTMVTTATTAPWRFPTAPSKMKNTLSKWVDRVPLSTKVVRRTRTFGAPI